jgi:hypothetical protein
VRKAPLLFTALATLALAAPACSDDDGEEAVDSDSTETTAPADTEPTDDTTGDTEPTDDTEAPEGGGACGEPGFDGEISRTADGDHAAASLTGDDIVAATGTTYSGGAGYTVYLSDQPIEGEVGLDTITAPEGAVVAMISFPGTTEDGEAIAAGDDLGAPTAVIIDSGGGASVSTMNAEGSIVITDVSEDQICFEIDYTDDAQTVNGTASIELVEPAF